VKQRKKVLVEKNIWKKICCFLIGRHLLFFFLWGHGARGTRFFFGAKQQNKSCCFVVWRQQKLFWRQKNKTTIVVLLFGAKKMTPFLRSLLLFMSKKVENGVIFLT